MLKAAGPVPIREKGSYRMTHEIRNVKLAQALFLARQGMHVFRLQPGKRIPASGCDSCRTSSSYYDGHHASECLCLRNGWTERDGSKVAATCHGAHAATTDPEAIRYWWGDAPTAGIGINLGKSGLVMIDIDAHVGQAPAYDKLIPGVTLPKWVTGLRINDGWDTLGILSAVRDAQDPWNNPGTIKVSTPSGGLHIWYRVPDADRWKSVDGKLAWQVDIKTGPAFAVAPGTRVDGKGSYSPVGPWGDGPGEMPAWLRDECERAGATPRATARYSARDALRNARRGPQDPLSQAYVDKVTAAVLEEFRSAPGGQRNTALNRAAFRLGKSLLSRDETLREHLAGILEDEAVAGGTPVAEARATVASGLAGGVRAAGK